MDSKTRKAILALLADLLTASTAGFLAGFATMLLQCAMVLLQSILDDRYDNFPRYYNQHRYINYTSYYCWRAAYSGVETR
jgi:hypothetical protein